MKIPFTKYCANGNDFIAIDNRRRLLSGEERAWITALCDRRRGVGADGLLLVESSETADFHMRIFNPDGSEAFMCGNGARACAQFARELKLCDRETAFSTRAGLQRVEFRQESSLLRLGDIRRETELSAELEASAAFVAAIRPAQFLGYLRAGVPHCVLNTEHAAELDLARIGSAARHWPAFGDEGSNVILVERRDAGNLIVRAWEKGVEAETEGCGTGCVAVAVLLREQGLVQLPVTCHMPGGPLVVELLDGQWAFSGSIHRSFEGRCTAPANASSAFSD